MKKENIEKQKALSSLKNKAEGSKAKEAFKWCFEIFATFVFAILVGIVMFQSVTMQESSMEPTLEVGEKLLVNRMAYKVSSPKRGDIIVFKTNASEDAALHIRRIIGLPGETIQISDGRILINGETYKEGKDFPTIVNAGMASSPVTLQNGEFFVLGDNRNNSEDSRYGDIGTVNKKYIVGKIWFKSSPLKECGFVKD